MAHWNPYICVCVAALSARKDDHCLTRNDHSITRLELEVFRNTPAQHDFVVAGRQPFNSGGDFSDSKDDNLVSCRDGSEPACDGNPLKQCSLAFEGISSGMCDFSE